MTAKHGRQLALALAAPAFLVLLVLQIRVARSPGHAQIATDLADISQSNAAMKQAMTDIQSAPLANYDSLAAASQQMTLAAARLPGDMHRVYSGRWAAQIDPAMQNFLTATAQKLTWVEDFKSRNALLQASRASSGFSTSLDQFSSDQTDAQISQGYDALTDAYETENTRVLLGALFSGLGFVVVSALLLSGRTAVPLVNAQVSHADVTTSVCASALREALSANSPRNKATSLPADPRPAIR